MTISCEYDTVYIYMTKKSSAKSSKKSSKTIAGFEPTKVALLVSTVAMVSIVLFTLMAFTRV